MNFGDQNNIYYGIISLKFIYYVKIVKCLMCAVSQNCEL